MSETEGYIIGSALVGGGLACLMLRHWLAKEKKDMNESWGMAKRSLRGYLVGATASGVTLVAGGVALLLWMRFRA